MKTSSSENERRDRSDHHIESSIDESLPLTPFNQSSPSYSPRSPAVTPRDDSSPALLNSFDGYGNGDRFSPRTSYADTEFRTSKLIDDEIPLPSAHLEPRWVSMIGLSSNTSIGLLGRSRGFSEHSTKVRRALGNWEHLYTELHQLENEGETLLHPMLLLRRDDDSERGQTLLAVVRRTLVNQNQARSYSSAQLSLATYLTDTWLSRYQRCALWFNTHVLLHPTSSRRLSWDILSVVICFYEAIMNPLYFVGLVGEATHIDITTAVFWTVDIFLSLITGYFTKEGLVELTHRKIVRRYARTWMTLDLLIVLIDWFVLIAGSDALEMVRVVKIVARIGRVVRLLRFMKLFPKLAAQMGRINSEMVLTLSRIVGLLVGIVFLNHYVACFFFITWSELEPDNSNLWRYTTALHWAMVHSALGSMDIYPKTPFERVFSGITLLVAFIMFSTLLSSITDAAAHIRSLHAARLRQEREVRRFFADNKISKRLACRVWHYISHHDLQVNKRPRCQDVELFQALPEALAEHVMCEAYTPTLVVHPLFSLYGVIEPEAMTAGVKACQQKLLWPKQKLECRKAPGVDRFIPDCMLFVTSQKLEYWPNGFAASNAVGVVGVPEEDEISAAAGSWLCEEAIWARSPLLLGPLVASPQGCDLITVTGQEFRLVVRKFPSSLHLVREYARRFIDDFNFASADPSNEDILFNSPVEALHRVVQSCVSVASVDIPSPALTRWVKVHAGTQTTRERLSKVTILNPSKTARVSENELILPSVESFELSLNLDERPELHLDNPSESVILQAFQRRN